MKFLGIIFLSIIALIIPFGGAYYAIFYNKIVGTSLSKSNIDRQREAFKRSKPYIENMVKQLAKYKMEYDMSDTETQRIIANNIKIEYANFNDLDIENYHLRTWLNKIITSN